MRVLHLVQCARRDGDGAAGSGLHSPDDQTLREPGPRHGSNTRRCRLRFSHNRSPHCHPDPRRADRAGRRRRPSSDAPPARPVTAAIGRLPARIDCCGLPPRQGSILVDRLQCPGGCPPGSVQPLHRFPPLPPVKEPLPAFTPNPTTNFPPIPATDGVATFGGPLVAPAPLAPMQLELTSAQQPSQMAELPSIPTQCWKTRWLPKFRMFSRITTVNSS